MFCKNCGTKLNEDAAFCPECGTKVGAAQANTALPPIQPVAPQSGMPQTSFQEGQSFKQALPFLLGFAILSTVQTPVYFCVYELLHLDLPVYISLLQRVFIIAAYVSGIIAVIKLKTVHYRIGIITAILFAIEVLIQVYYLVRLLLWM